MAIPSSNSLSWLPAAFTGANAGLDALKLENIEFKNLIYSPGDDPDSGGLGEESYKGGWRDGQPEGEGQYTWADGSTYEGSWSRGQKHGWGKYSWPSGASYLGEWRYGTLHGYGTFQSPDGSRYQGNWANNLKHGIGTKWHANGDRYEGLWRRGEPHGPGRYVWSNGNEYDGEWKNGKIHGQGTFKWATGHRYDGEWQEGVEEGIGVFTWPDLSTYEGFWVGGLKHGAGVFRPAPRAATEKGNAQLDSKESLRRSMHLNTHGTADAVAAFSEPLPPVPPSSVLSPKKAGVRGTSFDAAEQNAVIGTAASAPVAPPPSPRGQNQANGPRTLEATAAELTGEVGDVYACEYIAGELVMEEALKVADLEYVFSGGATAGKGTLAGRRMLSTKSRRGIKRQRRREDRMGQTIFKGSRSFDLMLNLQLGIRYTLATLSKLPPPAEVLPAHFEEKVWLRFPREGSELTPPHPSNDFKWKDYCPSVFRHLRGMFGISNSEYILSTCGDHALRELPSPGKSGSVFFVSQDERFIIKTMRKEEVKLLLRALPQYYAHVAAHPDTLLTRFYGVHRIKPHGGRKVRFVVMNNFFNTDLVLHRKFDLKGSTYKRTVGPHPKTTAIQKDLDLDMGFKLNRPVAERLQRQLGEDAKFLEKMNVMDYSLLLGVHFRGQGWLADVPEGVDSGAEGGAYASAASENEGNVATWGTASATAESDRYFGDYSESRTLSRTESALPTHHSDGAAGGLPASRKQSSMQPKDGIERISAPNSSGNNGSVLPLSPSRGELSRIPTADPPKVDRDYELTLSTHSMRPSNMAPAPVAPSRLGGFGLARFRAWRRDVKEKRRQKEEQAAPPASHINSGALRSSTSAAVEVTLEKNWSNPKRSLHRRTTSANAALESIHSTPVASPTGPSALPITAAPTAPKPAPGPSRSGSGIPKTLPKITYSDKLEEQHAALVASLAQWNASLQRLTDDANSGATDNTSQPPKTMRPIKIPELSKTAVFGSGGLATANIAFRADAAALPEDPTSTGREPTTPATARAYFSKSKGVSFAEDGRPASAPSTAMAVTASGANGIFPSPFMQRKGSAVDDQGSRNTLLGDSPTSANGGDRDRDFGAVTSPFLPRTGSLTRQGSGVNAGVVALRGATDMSQLQPEDGISGDNFLAPQFTQPIGEHEIEEVVSRMAGRVSRPISDQLARDLLRLARHRMLDPAAVPGARVPTTVLASRHIRSNSALAGMDMSPVDGKERQGRLQLTQSLSRHVPAMAVPLQDPVPGSLSGKVERDGAEQDVALFLGVIDWLQPYNARKRFEHGFKSVMHDGGAISVCEPASYAKRFMGLMKKVFIGTPEPGEELVEQVQDSDNI